MVLRQVRLELLRAFRGDGDPPRRSRALRMRLTDAEKQRLANCVWVRSDGAVFSGLRGAAAVELAQQTNRASYKYVSLWLSSRQCVFMVHRLVLWAFHADALLARAEAARAAGDLDHAAPDDFEAGHRDDDRANNRAENIVPLTSAENLRQSHARADRRSNAHARSRPVVVADLGPRAPPLPFAAGHEFPSFNEAARQLSDATGRAVVFTAASICCSANRGGRYRDVLFKRGTRADDEDEAGEVWRPAPESGAWCRTLGQAIRVSNRGRVWRLRGNIKLRGHEPNRLYRTVTIDKRCLYAHTVVWRVWNGAWVRPGEWVAAGIPEGLLVLHGGPGRAPNAMRRVGGYERNWVEDLRLGTRAENAADFRHELAFRNQGRAIEVDLIEL